ncbi:MAG: FAD-binding oxidoreductase, partial [bacterium]
MSRPQAQDIQSAMEGIVGSEAVLGSEAKGFARYDRDQSHDIRYRHAPDVVVFPSTTGEVAAILRYAHEHACPVTPRGGGTGLSGGAVPLRGGVCLAFERMKRIIDLDLENLTVTVQPGLVTADLDRTLAPHGLFFPGYPMSDDICTIGGNVAENAGGGRAVKYGVTGDYVLGLEFVAADGRVCRFGGKRLKDVTGYDMKRLIVGSEGTLGVVTEVTLRLLPRPRNRLAAIALFASTEAAIVTAREITADYRVEPSAVEYLDRMSLHETCSRLKETIPYEDASAMLLVETEGRSETEAAAGIEAALSYLRPRALYTEQAHDRDSYERFWKIRKRVPWTLKALGRAQSHEDLSVPVAAIPDMVAFLNELSAEHGISIPCFGHAADGNLHAVPICPD